MTGATQGQVIAGKVSITLAITEEIPDPIKGSAGYFDPAEIEWTAVRYLTTGGDLSPIFVYFMIAGLTPSGRTSSLRGEGDAPSAVPHAPEGWLASLDALVVEP